MEANSLKRKKAERSSAIHSVILGHSSVLGTGRPAPLPCIVTNYESPCSKVLTLSVDS